MPEFESTGEFTDIMAAIAKVKHIPPKGQVRILAVRNKGNTPWYQVEAKLSSGSVK